MNIAHYFIQHKTVTWVLIVLISLSGIRAYRRLGRLEDPEFTIKEAVIFTRYPGANAVEVEQEVTEPLETAIQQLKQLKEVRSISRPGVSIVFAEMQEVYDKETLPQVWDELRRKINDMSSSLPPGCQSPVINDDFGDVYGILYAITGDGYSLHDLKEMAEDLRRELLTCSDVGRIDCWGLPSEAVYVEMDRTRLTGLGLSISGIFGAIQQQNSVTESGRLSMDLFDVGLRVSGDYASLEELGEQLIEDGAKGRMLRLKDIATIRRDRLDPPTALLFWNGEPAIGMGISTVSGGNVIEMGESIQERLRSLEPRIPSGIELHAISHQANTVREAVQGFVLNLLEAMAIVIVLLMLFMGFREGVIIGVVLLLTILGTMLILQSMHITLQRISLGALIIALGMLVDNAIVIAEGIVVKAQEGLNRTCAAEETVCENQWPLLGATGIAILAFAAISLSKDMTGEWLKSLFQSICISLGLSWVLAITITPFLCVLFLNNRDEKALHPHDNRFFRAYRRLLGRCIDYRKTTLTVIGLLLALGMFGFSHVKQDFMPSMNRPQFMVDLWMPQGAHLEETAREMNRIQEYIHSLDGVTGVAGFAGQGALRFLLTYSPEMPDSAYGQMLVSVSDFRIIPNLTDAISAHIEQHHPHVTFGIDSFKLGPGGGAVEARISGPDTAVLRDSADQVRHVMRSHSNARTIRTDWGERIRTLSAEMAPARAREVGIARSDIANALARTFQGAFTGQYRDGDDLLPIMLRPPKDERTGVGNLESVYIWSSARQTFIPIEQVIDQVQLHWEEAAIHRLNRIRTISISCKPIAGTTDSLFRQLRAAIEAIPLPDRYTLEWGGEFEAATEANAKLMSNMPIAFVLMFVITVMLFNNLRQPLIIFLGLPLAVIGVAFGLLIANKPFGFMAMLGFLSLSGMLMKNKIVLLDQINLERKAGVDPYEAVLHSSVSRVRPVCMAAFTTVLGMLPLLWDAFFAPMAVTIMGGLTFATLLTLIITPVMYCAFYKIRRTP